MADIALGDDYALGRAGRSRSVNEIGRLLGGRAARARIGKGFIAENGDLFIDEHFRRDGRPRLRRETRRGEQALGAGVGETDGDAVDRRIGVECQPCGARFSDGELGDQQFEAARHPEADHVAWSDGPRD